MQKSAKLLYGISCSDLESQINFNMKNGYQIFSYKVVREDNYTWQYVLMVKEEDSK